MFRKATRRTPLTIRQERFAYEYLKLDGDGAEAVIAAFGDKTRNAARVAAFKLLKKPHVRRKVEELRNRMAKRADITVEHVLTKYEDAYNVAAKQDKAADMISAATAQAKLVGLLRDKVEHGNHGDFDDLDDISAIVDRVAQEAGPEAAQALLAALGYPAALPEVASETVAEVEALRDAEPPTGAIN